MTSAGLAGVPPLVRGRVPALVPQIADDHRTVSDLELRAAGVADPYPFDEAKRVC
jgi:hypothetical protein